MAVGSEVLGTATTGYIWPIIHDYILPGCQEEFYNQTFLLDQIKSSSKDVNGRQILIKHKLWRNRNAGSFTERGLLSQAKSRGFKESSEKLKFFSVQVDFSGQELALCKGKAQHIDLIADGFEDAMKGGLEEMNFIMWNNGTARRCQCNVDSTYAAGTGLTTVTFDGGSPLWMFARMDVTFGTDTTAYEVISVADDGLSFTVQGDATAVALDDAYVYRNGGYIATLDKDPNGLSLHCNTVNQGVSGLYQGLDRTAAGNEWLKAYVNGAYGDATLMTELLLMKHIRTHKAKTGEYPDFIVCDPPTFSSYVLLLKSGSVGTDYVVDEAGFKKDVKFIYAGQQMTLRVADDCWAQSMYFLTRKALEIREGKKFGWDMMGGGKLKVDKDTDTYWGRMLWYLNLICLDPKKLSVLAGVKPDAIT